MHFEQAEGMWPSGLGLSSRRDQYNATRLEALGFTKRVPTYSQVVNPTYMEATVKMMDKG